MGKSTISTGRAMFNSFLYVHQRVHEKMIQNDPVLALNEIRWSIVSWLAIRSKKTYGITMRLHVFIHGIVCPVVWDRNGVEWDIIPLVVAPQKNHFLKFGFYCSVFFGD